MRLEAGGRLASLARPSPRLARTTPALPSQPSPPPQAQCLLLFAALAAPDAAAAASAPSCQLPLRVTKTRARPRLSGARSTGQSTSADPRHSLADETEEVRGLRAKFGPKLATAKELFPDWTDEDVLYAIQEANGDLEVTIVRMSEGASLVPSSRRLFVESCAADPVSPPSSPSSRSRLSPHPAARLSLARPPRHCSCRPRSAVGRRQDQEGQEGREGGRCSPDPRRGSHRSAWELCRGRQGRSRWLRCVSSLYLAHPSPSLAFVAPWTGSR